MQVNTSPKALVLFQAIEALRLYRQNPRGASVTRVTFSQDNALEAAARYASEVRARVASWPVEFDLEPDGQSSYPLARLRSWLAVYATVASCTEQQAKYAIADAAANLNEKEAHVCMLLSAVCTHGIKDEALDKVFRKELWELLCAYMDIGVTEERARKIVTGLHVLNCPKHS